MNSRRNTAPERSEAELTALLQLKMLRVPDQRLNRLLPDHTPAELIRKLVKKPISQTITKRVELALAELQRTNTHVITVGDDAYPTQLAPLEHERPPIIFCRGNAELLESPMVAIVGTRRSTEYGNGVADMLAHDLARAGLTIISGLALGIDTHAHRGALSADGNTVAVLGCGIDVCYPHRNARLQQRIAEDGLLISEFAPGEPALAHHFLYRNRLIAALSRGVVVVEAGVRSGTANTVTWATQYGIDVFAVPGPIGREASIGTNELIQTGAIMVTSPRDVLEALDWRVDASEENEAEHAEYAPQLKGDAVRVYDCLGPIALQIDQIARATRYDTRRVLAVLAELELDGLVRQLAGKQFVRAEIRTATG